MSAARFLVVISAADPATYTTPISLLVGGLLVGLSSLGFLPREGSGTMDWQAGLLEFENLTRGQFCSVRCVEVFGCLHIYARLGVSHDIWSLRADDGDLAPHPSREGRRIQCSVTSRPGAKGQQKCGTIVAHTSRISSMPGRYTGQRDRVVRRGRR